MVVIDGLFWFFAALLVCGAHAAYLYDWRLERRSHLAQWKQYDVASQKRHEEFMRAVMVIRGDGIDSARVWKLSGSSDRGQA